MDDEAALDRMRAGDPRGLEALYRRHFAAVYRFAGRQCGDWHLAEDVAQETFVRAYRYAASHRPGAAATPWLLRIAYRLCLDRAAAAGRESPGLPGGSEPGGEDPHRAEARELEAAVSAALAGLPQQQRAAFLLRAVHGRSEAEVAEVLGCPTGTVKSRVYAARRRLTQLLGDRLEGGHGGASGTDSGWGAIQGGGGGRWGRDRRR